MRALNVAGFLIFLQLACVYVNAINIFPDTHLGVWVGPDIAGDLQSWLPKTNDTASYAILSLMSFVGFFVQSILFVVFILGYTTFLLPFFLGQLGLPLEATVPITAGVWLVYLIDYNEYRARMKTLSG